MKIEDFIRPDLLDIKPYSAARDEFVADAKNLVMLDANENNLSEGYNRYPSSNQLELRKAMAQRLGVLDSQLMFGNGSDEIIDLIIRLFATPLQDKMIVCEPTYGMYRVTAKLNGVEVIDIPLNESFESDLTAIKESDAKLLWICNPNNPTGNLMSPSQIANIITSFNGIVVVDEAYIDFCKENSVVSLIEKYPKLIVIQTFSKAKGLAGLRLGYAISNATTIAWLLAIKPPYSINSYTYTTALKQLQHNNWQQWISTINNEKERVAKALETIPMINKVFPSAANFILFEVENANELYQYLIEKGIVIRNRNKQINNALRVTIGTQIENNLFLKNLKEWQTN